jgi:hypothetical protein
MGSRFDNMQRGAVEKVNNLFGFPAVWNPADSSPQQTATILFKDPTQLMELGGLNEYSAQNILMEYKTGDFVGLRESANGGGNEVVTIDGTAYDVRQVNLKYDGKTFIAILESQ